MTTDPHAEIRLGLHDDGTIRDQEGYEPHEQEIVDTFNALAARVAELEGQRDDLREKYDRAAGDRNELKHRVEQLERECRTRKSQQPFHEGSPVTQGALNALLARMNALESENADLRRRLSVTHEDIDIEKTRAAGEELADRPTTILDFDEVSSIGATIVDLCDALSNAVREDKRLRAWLYRISIYYKDSIPPEPTQFDMAEMALRGEEAPDAE